MCCQSFFRVKIFSSWLPMFMESHYLYIPALSMIWKNVLQLKNAVFWWQNEETQTPYISVRIKPCIWTIIVSHMNQKILFKEFPQVATTQRTIPCSCIFERDLLSDLCLPPQIIGQSHQWSLRISVLQLLNLQNCLEVPNYGRLLLNQLCIVRKSIYGCSIMQYKHQ